MIDDELQADANAYLSNEFPYPSLAVIQVSRENRLLFLFDK